MTLAKRNPSRKIYGVTAITIGSEIVCPCCLELVSPSDTERHHVQWYIDKGHGYHWNILVVCKDCHAKMTRGGAASRVSLNALCSRYMLAEYGLLWALQVDEFRRDVCNRWMEGSTLSDYRIVDKHMKRMFAKEYRAALDVVFRGQEKEYWGLA